MMYLTLRTDAPEVSFDLYRGDEYVAREVWQADRTLAAELLRRLTEFLTAHDQSWHTLTGLVVYQGPGSFTGLRIGITTLNAVAYAQDIPIVGTTGENWLTQGLGRLQNHQNDRIVLPEYGAPPHITAPRK